MYCRDYQNNLLKKHILTSFGRFCSNVALLGEQEQVCSFEKVISVKCCSYSLSPLCPYITSKCHLQHLQQAWRPVTNSILMMFTLHCLDDVFNPTDSWQNAISARCNTDWEMNHGIIGTINHVLSFRFKIQLRQHGSMYCVAAEPVSWSTAPSQGVTFPVLPEVHRLCSYTCVTYTGRVYETQEVLCDSGWRLP